MSCRARARLSSARLCLQVLVDRTLDQPMRMSAQQAAPAIFHAMFSQVGG